MPVRLLWILALSLTAARSPAAAPPATAPVGVVVDGRWIRPGSDRSAIPEWGHANGLRVGLAPTRGPRGLLRIYAPYLAIGEPHVINYVAVEPITADNGVRGLSELERSDLDQHVRGKRFTSLDDPPDAPTTAATRPVASVARGRIERNGAIEMLVIWVDVERFDNGAHVCLRLRFRADRPHEVDLAAYARPDGAELRQCILTATMGNYARLRELHLAGQTVVASKLWPHHEGDAFTEHQCFSLDQLMKTGEGDALATAAPDEPRPREAIYSPGTNRGWRYSGLPAEQSWRCPDPPTDLKVCVNGRTEYWASHEPIPGGIAFENFEMVTPFKSGREFIFGVQPRPSLD